MTSPNRFWNKGQPLCSEPKYRVAMVAFKADLAFEKMLFHWETYDQNNVCRECMAHKTKPELLYTCTGPTAPWRLRPRTQAQYLAAHAHHLPPFVLIPGWSMACHRYDLMHVLFLGFGLHLAGSIIIDLVDRGYWAGVDLRSKLKQAWPLDLIITSG
jgi:hypothetical protein